MNLVIRGHQIFVTEKMRQSINSMIESLGALIKDATHVIVSVSGAKKNGWAPRIRVAVHFKKKIFQLNEFLRRYSKGEKGTDFYDLVIGVGNNLREKLASSLGFVETMDGGTRRTDKRTRRAIAGAKRYSSHLHGDHAPA